MRPLLKDNRSPAVVPSLRLIQGGQANLPALFTCPNQTGKLRLSKTACAGLHKRALQSDPYMDPHLAPCCECEIGAKHSGLKVASPPPKNCVRCGDQTFRFVGRLICVSCWNRQAEYIAGRNAKGVVPTKFIPLRIFDYVGTTVIGRDGNEAGRVCERMLGRFDPGMLVDLGTASPAEVGAWWEGTVKPWSAKRTHAVRKEFKL